MAIALVEDSSLGLASPSVYRSDRSSRGWQRVARTLDLSWPGLPAASQGYVKSDLLIIDEIRHWLCPLNSGIEEPDEVDVAISGDTLMIDAKDSGNIIIQVVMDLRYVQYWRKLG